jgi:hypothetical protein
VPFVVVVLVFPEQPKKTALARSIRRTFGMICPQIPDSGIADESSVRHLDRESEAGRNATMEYRVT